MFLTRISVAHPVFAAMMMAALAIFGLFSMQRLPVEQMPNVDIPAAAIVVRYDGASPEAVEKDVIEPIEDAMSALSGLDTMRSTAAPGQATVLLQFDLDVASAQAMDDVRDRLALAQAELPDRADKPVLTRFDPAAAPVVSLAISSADRTPEELTRIAESALVRPLQAIGGVSQVNLVGGLAPQIDVVIEPDRLAAYGVSVSDVTDAVAQAASDIPAGTVAQGDIENTIQIISAIATPEAFGDIVVGRSGGQPVYLRDVARVGQGAARALSLAFLNGERALSVEITKAPGVNTVAMAREVSQAIDRLGADGTLPGDVAVSVIVNDAVGVAESVSAVRDMLVEGALLSVAIVFLFLNSWRSTVITGLTLPLSMIATMIALNLLGFTLNLMTLMALTLSVGILIDDAIIVRENITRHLGMGKDLRRAALDGTDEIGLAVTATTFAIVAVFLPVAFMDGILGRFFLQFGVTVSVAVLVSLFVSFTLDPMLSSIWHDPAAESGARRGRIGRMVARIETGFAAVTETYLRLLGWSLRHRLATLGIALALLAGSLALIPRIGAEFLPPQDNGRVSVSVRTAPGSSLDYTGARAAEIARMIATREDVASVYTSVGGAALGDGAATDATLSVILTPAAGRARSAAEVAAELRAQLAPLAGIVTTVSAEGSSPSGGKPVSLNVYGDDIEVLRRIGEEVADRLAAIPGIEDIGSSMDAARPILGVRIDRERASELGITPHQIAGALAALTNGSTVAKWTDSGGRGHDVVVTLDDRTTAQAGGMDQLPVGVSATSGDIIRLGQIAATQETLGQSSILRENASRRVTIDANLSASAPGDVYAQVNRLTQDMRLPAGYRFDLGGDVRELAEASASAAAALGMAVLFIYLILASQFGSLLQPLAIMASLPLSVIGVLAGLFLGGSTLNVMSMIGIIMLMGLVVKNAILLVDQANRHLAEGFALDEALIRAGALRFRPIVMTTLAMMAGMVPMAINLHHGSGQNAPMAHAVIGGLLTSTLLTLVVVPVLLTYLAALGRLLRRPARRRAAHPVGRSA